MCLLHLANENNLRFEPVGIFNNLERQKPKKGKKENSSEREISFDDITMN